MDIAAFVGFAAAGPLHCPVPIEDPNQFAAIFGVDATLAWDEQRGEWATAHLAPTVRAFLRNGGRRCWVVRVADTAARPDAFPLPGALEAAVDERGGVALRPAFGWARSEGSWADGLRLGAAVTAVAQVVQSLVTEAQPGRLALRIAGELRPGDLVRIHYPEAGLLAFMAVEQVTFAVVEGGPDVPDGRVPERSAPVYHGTAAWFAGPSAGPALGALATLTWHAGPGATTVPVLAVVAVPSLEPGTLQVSAALDIDAAPPPGALICLRPGAPAAGETWLMVRDVRPGGPAESSPAVPSPFQSSVLISGPAFAAVPQPAMLPAQTPLCVRLSLDLSVLTGGDISSVLRLADLDFAAAAPRYWGALPTDAELFAPADAPETGYLARERRETYVALWRQAATPRFPLAGSDPRLAPAAIAEAAAARGRVFTVPLGLAAPGPVAAAPEQYLPAAIPGGAALERDGLAQFSRGLFLDRDLRDTLATELLGRADDIRYIAPAPRPLQGIHAILAVDEVTLLAAPDALHRPWQNAPRALPPAPDRLRPLPHPSWWHFRGCNPQVDLVVQPPWGNFLDCGLRVVDPPALRLVDVDRWGTVTLAWDPPEDGAGGRYILQEATRPDFSDAYTIYEGEELQHTLYSRSAGDYYYHVRVVVGANFSDWSAGVVARVAPEGGWRIPPPPARPAPAYDLLSIQRGLLRMCAARGDILAVLSLPERYREDEAMAHVAALAPSPRPVYHSDREMLDLPLGYGERSALSYGALYHPWLTGREENGGMRRIPPDGAVCGMVARRTLARGAWIAPANEPLNGAVALDPAIARARWPDLQEAQINIVRQEPHGFVTLSADTLSSDPDLLQINVRRLLQLLRRLALRLGTGFVFEPHDDAFRRLVRREVESVLRDLFGRGAFAGPTPETSYQVVFRSTPQDVDNGRFIVDIRVAPALPLTFLTVRLVQSGSRTTVSEER